MTRMWMRRTAVLMGVLLLSMSAWAITVDEVLDAMDLEEERAAEGGLLSTVRVENEHSDGTTSGFTVYGLTKPNMRLMYFAEPALDEGITYLFVDEAVDGKTSTRFWLHLPVFGLIKELVSEDDLGGGFAGSSLSLSDVGGEERRADYDTVLLPEETLTIGEVERTAYVLDMTAKAEADVEDSRVVMWIDSEFFIMLKSESYDDLGNLASRTEVLELEEFEERLTMRSLLSVGVSDGSQSTFTFTNQRRPDGEIPDDVFTPEAIGSFVPADWGF